MTKLEAMCNAVIRFNAACVEAGVQVQGIIIDHESLMEIKIDPMVIDHLKYDAKYKTTRIHFADIQISAGDSTRQWR